MPADFLQRALAPFSLRTGEIAVETSPEGVPCRVVGGLFLERRVGAQGHLGGEDLRSRPRPLDGCLFEGDAAITAVELILKDEALAAAATNADAKARKRIIEGDDFGLAGGHFERCNCGISQAHRRSSWESGKMNSTSGHAWARVKTEGPARCLGEKQGLGSVYA